MFVDVCSLLLSLCVGWCALFVVVCGFYVGSVVTCLLLSIGSGVSLIVVCWCVVFAVLS